METKNVILSLENTKLLKDDNVKQLIQDYASQTYFITKEYLKETQYKGIYTYKAKAIINAYQDLPIEKQLKLYIVDFDFNKTERAQFLNGETVKGFQYDKNTNQVSKIYDIVVIARI